MREPVSGLLGIFIGGLVAAGALVLTASGADALGVELSWWAWKLIGLTYGSVFVISGLALFTSRERP